MLKKGIAASLALALLLLTTGALADFSAAETLFERVERLLEEGDESIHYLGIGLPVGMDDADQPKGAVIVEIDVQTGTIVAFHEKDYWIWDFLEPSDCANTLLILCGRWGRLTSGTDENLYVKLYPEGRDAGKTCFLISSQEEADALLQSVYDNLERGE